MASKKFAAFVNMGAFTGKQMKAICAFTSKNNENLDTPFFYNDYLLASDSFCAISIEKDAFQKHVFPAEYAYKLPNAPLEKIAASDVFYFTQPATKDDMATFVKLESTLSTEVDNVTSKLEFAGKALLGYLSDNNKGVLANEINTPGIDPKFMKKVCNLAEAFNTDCMNIEYVMAGSTPLMRITFPYEPRIKVIICPQRNK